MIVVALDVVDAMELPVGDAVLVEVQDEFKYVFRGPGDRNGRCSLDHPL